jgi:hypothetical protein
MALPEHKIEQVLNRSGVSRYNYFIEKAVENEEVFGLADDEGWVMLEDDADNSDVIPFFAEPEFAEVFKTVADLGDNRVEALDLMEFLEWLEDFSEEKIKVGVMLNRELNGAVMEAAVVLADLEKAMAADDAAAAGD